MSTGTIFCKNGILQAEADFGEVFPISKVCSCTNGLVCLYTTAVQSGEEQHIIYVTQKDIPDEMGICALRSAGLAKQRTHPTAQAWTYPFL